MSLFISNLSARYGRLEVCRNIRFEMATGEFLVVLGPNGAGKSSLLGAIAGLVASSGEVRLDSQSLSGRTAHRRAHGGIAFVPEGRRNLFMPLSVEDNMRLGLRLLPKAGRGAMREQLHSLFPILSRRAAQLAGMLSGGEQQMLAIAVAMARRPAVLLLDEPTQGLAPVVLDELAQAIRALRGLGLSVLLAEQNHQFAALLGDRFLVLHSGEIVDTGVGAELRDPGRMMAAMIG